VSPTFALPAERWYRRAARGAVAGAVATVAMSAVQFPGAARGGRRPPPFEITRRLHHRAGTSIGTPSLLARGTALHLAFGASAGTLYALVAPARLRELSAPAFASVLYGVAYRSGLPALSLHPHADHDDRRRQRANAVAHLVYGITLAELLRWTDPRDDGTSAAE
jgi:hypothetical protein